MTIKLPESLKDHKKIIVDTLRMMADKIESGEKSASPMNISFNQPVYGLRHMLDPSSMDVSVTLHDLGEDDEVGLESIMHVLAETYWAGESDER